MKQEFAAEQIRIQMSRAIAAFEMGRFNEVLDALLSFCSDLSDLEQLDALIYNDLWDAVWMLDVLWDKLFLLNKNDYVEDVLSHQKSILENYKGLSLPKIEASFSEFITSWTQILEQTYQLLELAQRLGVDYTHDLISFDINKEGEIRFFVWHSEEEDQDRQNLLKTLEAAFNACFEEDDAQNIEQVLTKSREGTRTKNWELAAKNWRLLIDNEKLTIAQRREVFYGLGEAYFNLDKWEEALDIFMKSMLVGVDKEQIKPMAKQSARYLLMYSESPKEQKHWRKFLNRFN